MPTPTKPSPAAREQRHLVLIALDDAYDREKQRYRPGNTDAQLAAAVGSGCPPALVASIREDFFGPPGEPDEIAEVRSGIAGLTSDLAKLRSRFDTICKEQGFAA